MFSFYLRLTSLMHPHSNSTVLYAAHVKACKLEGLVPLDKEHFSRVFQRVMGKPGMGPTIEKIGEAMEQVIALTRYLRDPSHDPIMTYVLENTCPN